MWDTRRKYNIPNSMEELLGKNCEVEKLMNFLKDIQLIEDIDVMERKW